MVSDVSGGFPGPFSSHKDMAGEGRAGSSRTAFARLPDEVVDIGVLCQLCPNSHIFMDDDDDDDHHHHHHHHHYYYYILL